MGEWNKYVTEDVVNDTKVPVDNMVENNDDRTTLTVDGIRELCGRLSGKNEQGLSKSIITYQSYDSGFTPDETKDKNADIIYNCSKASATLSFDVLNPGLILLSITFPTYDDPELRLLWARIQKWRTRNSGQEALKDDVVPVFLIHLMERNSIGLKTDMPENILEANIVNPLICYLTRETSTSPAVDLVNEKGETMGGNVIKMLCNMEFVTFSIIEDADTTDIKAEILREAEAARYLNTPNTDTSSEYNLN